MSTSSTGTIDITNLVGTLRSTWVEWATAYVFGAAVATPGLQWMALPVISTVVKWIIEKAADYLAGSAEMGAFFLNTAIKKASQAKDFTDAVHAKKNLPDTATIEEYERAEQNQMAAFRSFVSLTS